MTKSPYLNLTLTPETDNQKKFSVYRTEMSGDDASSNMMLIDSKMQELYELVQAGSVKKCTWGDLKNGSSTDA